jgi:hypothetical protein
MRSCIFCGVRGLTKEHVLPRWLSEVLPGEGEFVVERVHEPRNGIQSSSDWSAPALNLTARCACADCNNGWMSDLEEAAKPHLTPMIHGRATSLSRDVQTTLALWLVKTVAVCEQAVPGEQDVMPDTWHRAMFETRRPPVGAWVWLARYAGGEFRPGATRTAQWYIHPLRLESSSGSATGLSMVLSLGELVFQFMGVFRDDADAVVLEKHDPFLRLWPKPIYRAPWPPAAAPLSDADLEGLALSFAP